MAYEADIAVLGVPKTKGSWQPLRRGDRIVLVQDCKQWRPWARAIRLAASQHAPATLLDAPVELELYFNLPRPQKPRFNVPATPPDWDKLGRAVSDALTGVIYVDDARVVRATVSLAYGRPGCRIVVRELTDQEELF